VAFSPDGRRLATAGVDGTVKLWDLPSLREVATFTGHEGPVNSVAFSPDGLTLASASEDATVQLWQALPADQVHRSPAETPIVSKPMDVVRFFGLELLEKTQATVTSNGKEYEVHVTAVDSTDWHVQLIQKFDDLVEGGTYEIRFRAKADVPRDIQLHAQRNGVPDWQNIGLNKSISITKKWETYEVKFQAKEIAATVNKIHFILGQQTGTVWIADFTVTKLADADPNDPEIQSQVKRRQLMQAAERGSKEALPLLAADVAADPKDTFRSLKAAALLAWFGQEKDLAAMLQHIRAFAKDTKEAETAERAAKACSLALSASGAEREAALALARKAVRLDAGGQLREWTHVALGMAEYRNDNYAAALEALDAAAKAGPKNLRVTGIAAFYRAMSLFRQGKEAEARRVASAAAATMKPLPKDEQRPLADQKDYHDDLILWLAYKEAKALIKFGEAPPKD
jgi:tetratricopeptide (TPR) repeat protein